VAELIAVADRQFKLIRFGNVDKFLRLVRMQGERLFDVDMTAAFQALSRNLEVAFSRSCNMHYIWPKTQQFIEFVNVVFDWKTFPELLGHEQFAVASGYNFSLPDPHYLRGMCISYSAASNNPNSKHDFDDQTQRNNDAYPRRWTL